MRLIPECRHIAGVGGENMLIALPGRVILSVGDQPTGKVKPCFDMVGRDGQRLPKGLDRGRRAPLLQQRDAKVILGMGVIIVMNIHEIRVEAQCLTIPGAGFDNQGAGQVEAGFHMIRVQLHRSPERLNGLGNTFLLE